MNFSIYSSRFCSFLTQTKPTSNAWIPIVIGVVLLLGFLGLLIWLYVQGKLTQWVQAGRQSGKWKLRDMQLVNEAKKSERAKLIQIEELGRKAWKARVSDPSYAQPWSDLEGIETQIAATQEHARSLRDNLTEVQAKKDDLIRGYDEKIGVLDLQLKDSEQKLKTAQFDLRQLENELESLANEKGLLQRDIKATRTDLINTEGSDEPDRDEILGSLNTRLDGLVHNLLEVSNAEPELAGKIPARQSEVLALNTRVNELAERVHKLENQKRIDLEPLDQQLEALDKQIKSKTDEVTELEKRMDPIIKSLGHMVDTARPASDELQNEYTSLDKTYQKLAEISQERGDLANKLDALDKDASRNFYLLIALGVVVLVLAILLIANVF